MRESWFKIRQIAYREYVAMVGTKAFVFSIVMMPLLMLGSLLVVPAIEFASGPKTLRIVVADATGELMQPLLHANSQRDSYRKSTEVSHSDLRPQPSKPPFDRHDRFEWIPAETPRLDDDARERILLRIRAGELYGLLEISSQILDPEPTSNESRLGEEDSKEDLKEQVLQSDGIQFYSIDSLMSPARMWAMMTLEPIVQDRRLRNAGLDLTDPLAVKILRSRLEVHPRQPAAPSMNKTTDPHGVAQTQTASSLAMQSMLLPFGIMIFMLMVLLMAAQPMLESSMEEKSLRIAEVLLGAVSSTELMAGKLLGNVAGSMVIFILYGASGLCLLSFNGMLGAMPHGLIFWFIIFQILGVLFFSSIFMVVGASVNELKEAQTLLLPVWTMLLLPVMSWLAAAREPNGLLATSASFFPPSASMMMVMRLATGTTIPTWQPALSAVILILSTTGMVLLAGRIYRAGLLRQDGVRSIMQLIRRLRSID